MISFLSLLPAFWESSLFSFGPQARDDSVKQKAVVEAGRKEIARREKISLRLAGRRPNKKDLASRLKEIYLHLRAAFLEVFTCIGLASWHCRYCHNHFIRLILHLEHPHDCTTWLTRRYAINFHHLEIIYFYNCSIQI